MLQYIYNFFPVSLAATCWKFRSRIQGCKTFRFYIKKFSEPTNPKIEIGSKFSKHNCQYTSTAIPVCHIGAHSDDRGRALIYD